VRLVKAARPFHVAIKVSALTKIIFFQKGAAHASETSLCIYSSRLFGINIVCTCGLIVQMVINATQRNVNGLVLVDGSPGANGGPGENGGTAGLEAQGKTAVAEGMVGMEMVPVTVEMAEMVAMAGTDETRYVAQM